MLRSTCLCLILLILWESLKRSPYEAPISFWRTSFRKRTPKENLGLVRINLGNIKKMCLRDIQSLQTLWTATLSSDVAVNLDVGIPADKISSDGKFPQTFKQGSSFNKCLRLIENSCEWGNWDFSNSRVGAKLLYNGRDVPLGAIWKTHPTVNGCGSIRDRKIILCKAFLCQRFAPELVVFSKSNFHSIQILLAFPFLAFSANQAAPWDCVVIQYFGNFPNLPVHHIPLPLNWAPPRKPRRSNSLWGLFLISFLRQKLTSLIYCRAVLARGTLSILWETSTWQHVPQ